MLILIEHECKVLQDALLTVYRTLCHVYEPLFCYKKNCIGE